MAKRIMHSVLPAVADKATLALSKGVIDYKALEAAIEGRKDIIKYGVKACLNELDHYATINGRKPITDATSLNLRMKILKLQRTPTDEIPSMEAIDTCIQTFSDDSGWDANFGGFAWEKIAKQLKTLIILDEKLDILRKEKANPDDKIRHRIMDEEVAVMKQILMELNVFDGMAHNTAEVMNNLLEVEQRYFAKKFKVPVSSVKQDIEEKQLKELMDAKELENPLDVYREIEDILKGSGDIHRYKDWTTKLRQHPDYIASDLINRQNEKMLIAFKKQVPKRIEYLKRLRDKASTFNSYDHLHPFIYEINEELSSILSYTEKSKKLLPITNKLKEIILYVDDLRSAEYVGTNIKYSLLDLTDRAINLLLPLMA